MYENSGYLHDANQNHLINDEKNIVNFTYFLNLLRRVNLKTFYITYRQ